MTRSEDWKPGRIVAEYPKPKASKTKESFVPDGYKRSLISGIYSVPPAEQLVRDLTRFSGDVTRFLSALHNDEVERKNILVSIVLELDKPENAEHKKQWFAVESAHKKALMIILENDFLKAIGGNSGKTREERTYAIYKILPPNFRLADLKFFFSAYFPEKYRPARIDDKNQGDVVLTEPERDATMDAILDVLDGDKPDCQEAEDSETQVTRILNS